MTVQPDRWDPGPRGPYRPPLLPPMRFWTVTQWLVAVNVAVFVLQIFSGGLVTYLGAFSVADALYGLQLWRFVTFQFLHASPTHLLFNMLALWFFGPIVEQRLGRVPYLVYYLLCGISGAVFLPVLWALGLLHLAAETPLVGASAGIFGVLVGAATIAPRAAVQLLFPPVTLSLRTLALIYLALAGYTVFRYGPNAGGQAAHLGGALTGYLLMRNPRVLARLVTPRRPTSRFWRPGDAASKFFRGGPR